MSRPITVADLRDQIGAPEPRPVLYCKKCGSTHSADAGDYFYASRDMVLSHCGEPMSLVVRRVVFDEVVVEGSDVDAHGARLDAMLAAHEAALEVLAECVRAEVVVPLCRKHRLTFSSGMGVFFFRKKHDRSDRTYGHRQDLEVEYLDSNVLSASAKAALGLVLDLLNKEIDYNTRLGHCVADVE